MTPGIRPERRHPDPVAVGTVTLAGIEISVPSTMTAEEQLYSFRFEFARTALCRSSNDRTFASVQLEGETGSRQPRHIGQYRMVRS